MGRLVVVVVVVVVEISMLVWEVDKVDITCLPPANELSGRLLSEYMLGV